MRTAFVRTLLALARKNPDLMLLTGDLGFTVLEEFRDTLPRQYINAGVAEQNMIGMAAGLALGGKRVFTYSIIPFTTFRCLEHIRNDVCYHNVPVCIVGVGGGYSYGHMGSTHHALEDIAILRSLANMTVVCPGDPLETEAAMKAISAHDGPCYLRLGKAGEPKLHTDVAGFSLGKAITMREGNAITIIATSTMLATAVQVADALKNQGIKARLLSMHTIKPLDEEAVMLAARQTKGIVTIEEHSRIGGLGSAVAETISLKHVLTPHLLCAAPDAFAPLCGSQTYLRAKAGLSPEQLMHNITAFLNTL